MPPTSVHELLGLPASVQRPNPYEVFGLTPGRHSDEAITAAIGRRIQSLRQVRDQVAEPLWKDAARVVQTAKATLTDPDRRAQLDQRLGVSAPVQAASDDPLAAFLTPAQPAATPAPAAERASPAPQPVAVSPQPVPTPPIPPAAPSPEPAPVRSVAPPALPTAAATSVAAPVVRSRRRPRRRKSVLVPLFMFSMIVALLAGSGYLIYRMFLVDGGIKVVRNGNAITFQPGNEPVDEVVVSPPTPPTVSPPAVSPPSDGVLAAPPAPRGNPSDSLQDAIGQIKPPAPMPAEPVVEVAPPPAMTPTPTTETPPPITPAPMTNGSPAEVEAAKQLIQTARQAFATADWSSMKPAAEAAVAAAANDEQRKTAQTIYEAADLATFYREGIRLAISELQTGAEFDINGSVKVLVVEATPQRLVVRRGATNKTFEFDELPISITRTVIEFKLPASPTTRAAGALFEAIAAKATPEHRVESIETLRQVDGEIQGGDGKALADFIESLPPAAGG